MYLDCLRRHSCRAERYCLLRRVLAARVFILLLNDNSYVAPGGVLRSRELGARLMTQRPRGIAFVRSFGILPAGQRSCRVGRLHLIALTPP